MTTAANHATILVSELHVMPSDIMRKNILKSALLIIFVVIVVSAAAEQVVTPADTSTQDSQPSKDLNAETTRKNYEPASKFVPSEKLRADDAISFPVDI